MTDAPTEPTNSEPTKPEHTEPTSPEPTSSTSADVPDSAGASQPTEVLPESTNVVPANVEQTTSTQADTTQTIPAVVPNPAPSTYSSVTPPPAAPPAFDTTAAEPPRKRAVSFGVVVAAAAVAAIVGAGAGAGIGISYASNSNNTGTVNSNPASITVNNAKTATAVGAVAAKASPSVVTISVTGTNAAGTGSGIIMTADGYVVTNNHVVTLDGESASSKIQVETNDGRLINAKVVGTDPIDDLAVIKLQNVSGLQPAQFADSGKLNVGDTAIAIGAPLGLAGSVTNGIVSALNRSITVASSAAPTTGDGSGGSGGSGSGQNQPFDFWGQGQSQAPTASSTISLSVIQTDAAINPGNSGGALLNSDGQVIGVNCAIASAGDSSSSAGSQSGSIGVGFAIPSNLVLRIANDIIKNGSATHGLLGASVQDVTEDSSQTNAKTVGASIYSVSPGGAAAAAGLKKDDIVTNFNGIPITSANDLTAQVRAVQAGAKASLTYVRGSHATKVTVTLGTLK